MQYKYNWQTFIQKYIYHWNNLSSTYESNSVYSGLKAAIYQTFQKTISSPGLKSVRVMVQVGLSPGSRGTCEECAPSLITYVILIYIISGRPRRLNACSLNSLQMPSYRQLCSLSIKWQVRYVIGGILVPSGASTWGMYVLNKLGNTFSVNGQSWIIYKISEIIYVILLLPRVRIYKLSF